MTRPLPTNNINIGTTTKHIIAYGFFLLSHFLSLHYVINGGNHMHVLTITGVWYYECGCRTWLCRFDSWVCERLHSNPTDDGWVRVRSSFLQHGLWRWCRSGPVSCLRDRKERETVRQKEESEEREEVTTKQPTNEILWQSSFAKHPPPAHVGEVVQRDSDNIAYSNCMCWIGAVVVW